MPSFDARPELLRGRRTLIADDLPEARDALAAITDTLGMRSSKVADGMAALTAIANADAHGDPYDLFLLDWRMPGLDGIETMSRMTAQHLSRRPICLLITAFDEQALSGQARAVGFDAVLGKPLTASRLVDALATVMAEPMRQAVVQGQVAQSGGVDLLGKLILLVEDNPVNQEVMQELLTDVGIRVDVANNGLEAMRAAEHRYYDLVLMDMQMPELDGLEATRRIRRLEGWRDIPIVAMTANAFQEDKEACLQAGMNDHLAKPVDPPVLFAMLNRWIRATPQAMAQCHASFALQPQPTPVSTSIARQIPDAMNVRPTVNAPVLDTELVMVLANGRIDLAHKVIGRFIAHHANDGENLLHDMVGGNDSNLLNRVHALKGGAGQIGATRLFGHAADLEARLRAGQQASPDIVTELLRCIDDTLNEAHAWMAQHAQSNMHGQLTEPAVTDPAWLRERLAELRALLENVDSRSLSVAEELCQRLPVSTAEALRQELSAVVDLLRDFDIEIAKKRFEVLKPQLEESFR